MKTWGTCTNAQKIERWENCLRVLQSLTPHERRKHWDMSNWGVKTDCGTVACAAGHCGLDPWFRRRGLRLVAGAEAPLWTARGEFVGLGMPGDIVKDFFGKAGSEDIFFDGEPRSVGTVIKEVKAHIKQLKAGDEDALA